MKELTLDPVGYFLIKINKESKEIEIAFCKYEEIKFGHQKARFGKNTINRTLSSKNPSKILKWIKENKLYSKKDHFNYLKKELEKAKECLEKEVRYIQD